MFALVTAALAAEEEIIVWGDRFARWEERWTVTTQVELPGPMTLLADNNLQIEALAFRLTLSIDCGIDHVLFKWSREVSCRIEDVGLVVRPRLFVDTNELVVRELDATLTDAVLQLQVQQDGDVPDVDLEGLHATNRRENQRAQQLRQLLRVAMVPFHLELPDPVRDGAQWYERNSPLFSLPSIDATRGGLTLAHYLNAVDSDHFVIQSVGKASATGMSGTHPRDILTIDMTGVALVEQATWVMNERVWALRGEFTPSSPSALTNRIYHYSGRLRRLGQGEHIDVGPSFVARSPNPKDDAPEWVYLEP